MVSTLRGSYSDTLEEGLVGNRRRILMEVVLWVFALFLAWVFARPGI